MMEVAVPWRSEKAAMTVTVNVAAEVRQRRHPEMMRNQKVFFVRLRRRNPQSYLDQLQRHREIR